MTAETKTKLANIGSYVVVDTETTGLDASWCEIIEIAALKVEEGIVVDRFHSLVRPNNLPIPAFIADLTGITNDMLLDAPSMNEIALELSLFLGEETLVGHNVCFDAKFLSAALKRNLSNELVDTMRISRHVNRNLSSHRLEAIYGQCIKEGAQGVSGDFHKADYDAEITRIAYEHMKPKLVVLYGDDPEIGWRKQRNQEKHSSRTKKCEIIQTVEEIDESNPFFGAHVCFTGKMDSMTRNEAWQRLVNLGGIIEENTVKALDYLVVGNAGFVSGVKGDKSDKIKKAESNQLKGLPVQIISEDFFMEFAGDA